MLFDKNKILTKIHETCTGCIFYILVLVLFFGAFSLWNATHDWTWTAEDGGEKEIHRRNLIGNDTTEYYDDNGILYRMEIYDGKVKKKDISFGIGLNEAKTAPVYCYKEEFDGKDSVYGTSRVRYYKEDGFTEFPISANYMTYRIFRKYPKDDGWVYEYDYITGNKEYGLIFIKEQGSSKTSRIIESHIYPYKSGYGETDPKKYGFTLWAKDSYYNSRGNLELIEYSNQKVNSSERVVIERRIYVEGSYLKTVCPFEKREFINESKTCIDKAE